MKVQNLRDGGGAAANGNPYNSLESPYLRLIFTHHTIWPLSLFHPPMFLSSPRLIAPSQTCTLPSTCTLPDHVSFKAPVPSQATVDLSPPDPRLLALPGLLHPPTPGTPMPSTLVPCRLPPPPRFFHPPVSSCLKSPPMLLSPP